MLSVSPPMLENASPVEANPYLAPESLTGKSPTISTNGQVAKVYSPLIAGMVAWIGTGLAGGLFGFGLAGYIGLIFGLIYASVGAMPVAALIYVALALVYRKGLNRRQTILSAAACGAVTGFGMTLFMFQFQALEYAFGAGIVGSIVPPILAAFVPPSNSEMFLSDAAAATWSDLE